MSEDESPSDGGNSRLVRTAARQRRPGSIRKRLEACLLIVVMKFAVANCLATAHSTPVAGSCPTKQTKKTRQMEAPKVGAVAG